MATTTDKYSTLTTGGLEVNNPTLGKTLYVNANGFVINGTYIDPLNLSAVSNNITNTALNLSNSVIVQNTKISPTKTITTQAGDPTQVGQIFGLNYYDASLNDLSIQTTAGQGGVVFKESGTGASANSAKIKQGTITSTNGTNTTTITPTSVTTTNFIGDLSGNAVTATNATNAINTSTTLTTTSGTYYPVFVSNNVSGNYPNLVGTMTYNPSSNTITANTFNGVLSGTATNATNVGITSDNTSGTYYIPFAKTSGTGNKPLFIDDTTTPLSYNPNTGVLTAVSYAGSGASLTGITATTATNATNVGITDTTTTAGTYYPTFVSANTGNVPLRVDSQYLQYNPSTNILQNPNFLVSNGTETSSTGGLLLTTGGVGSKTISSTNTTGATNNFLSIQTTNTGNSSSSIYDTRYAGSGTGGTGITAFPSWSLYSSFFTPLPAGTPYSQGYFNMLGSCCNMATQLVPNGSESNVAVGFQSSIGDNNGYADMFYNPDTYSGTSPYILRLDGNGNLKYGIGTAGTYAFGTPNPTALSSTYFSVNSNGTNIANPVNNYTFVATTLTLNFQSTSFRNFYNATAITSAITQSAVSFSNAVAGGSYMVYITTGSGGSLTFNTGITGVKTTFASAFTIPASSFAVMSIYYINSVYVIGINILT